ncbi:MAG: amino acid permease [Gemmatimonadota bacterium]|jgi:APA family basic amino acid/polyamine antiporter
MSSRNLDRTLGLRDLSLLVVGVVIGSGIFIVPATVLSQVGGDVGIAQLVWLAGGLLALIGALTLGEVGAARPQTGGLYVFLRDAFGPLPAFLFGWTMFLAIGAGATAALGAAFAGYVGQFVNLPLPIARSISVLMVAAVAFINIRGTRGSTSVQNWTTGFKMIALLAMAAALIIAGPGLGAYGESGMPHGLGLSVLPSAGVAIIGVLWAYEGWSWVSFSVGEAKDAARTFPRAMAIGTVAIIALYSISNYAYVAVLGPERAMASTGIAAEAVSVAYGGVAGRFVAAAILVAIFSAANGTMLTASRVFFAMARDGLFFRSLARIHPRHGTPATSITALALWAMVLAASGTFEQLLTYAVFTAWIFYALGAATVFVFRQREPATDRPFGVPGYPVTPAIFIIVAAAIVVNTIVEQPARAGVGLAVVFAGVPAYLVWRGRRAT